MALDRLLPVSTTPGAVTGDDYMDAVQEEVTGLWDRSVITLTSAAGTNTITATATPALTASLGGSMNFILKPAATNTGAVTLNINGGGAVDVVDAEGTALTAGALRINGNYLLHYDSGISKHVVVGYVPATTVTPGMKFIASGLASSAAAVDFFNGAAPSNGGSGTVTATGTTVFDNTYDAYMVEFSTVKPATDQVELWLRFGTGGTPTYQATNYQYAFTHQNTSATTNFGSTSATRIILGCNSTTAAVGNATGENISGRVYVPNPEATDFHTTTFQVGYIDSTGGLRTGAGSGCWTQGTAITALRFMFSSGNISSGRFTLYGQTKTT